MTASLEITTTARADDDVDIDSSATISRGKAPNRLFIFAKVTLFVCLIVGVGRGYVHSGTQQIPVPHILCK